MPFNLKEKEARKTIQAKIEIMEKRLEEIYSDYAADVGTLEAKLDSARIGKTPDATVGANLSEKHVGTKEAVTEKKLDSEKSMFSEHRKNVSGDVPKLEEKRLANKPVEKEKYQSANS